MLPVMLRRPISRLFSTTSAANSSENYDIAIIGGGLVGNSLACSLGSIFLKKILFFFLFE